MAYLDCEKVKKRLKASLNQQMEELSRIKAILNKTPDSKKYNKKNAAILEQIVAIKQQTTQMEHLEKRYGKIIDIATAYFILYEDEAIYVSSGAFDKFRSFLGSYAIQWYMIKEALRLDHTL